MGREWLLRPGSGVSLPPDPRASGQLLFPNAITACPLHPLPPSLPCLSPPFPPKPPGHEKYFRTTAYGLTGHLPDYACMIVGANMGVVGMAKEHLGVALALKVPVFFVITKTDIAPEHVLKSTLQVGGRGAGWGVGGDAFAG